MDSYTFPTAPYKDENSGVDMNEGLNAYQKPKVTDEEPNTNADESSSLLHGASYSVPFSNGRKKISAAGLLLVVAVLATSMMAVNSWNGGGGLSSLADSLSLPLLGSSKRHRHHRDRKDEVVATDRADDDGPMDDDLEDDDRAPKGGDKGAPKGDDKGAPKHHGGGHGARECTFLECWQAGCSWEKAPFACLKFGGGPHGGCANVPWEEGTCDEQCDLSNCEDVKIPKSTDTCEKKQCSDEKCCGAQKCGKDAPYQCLEGAARYGCHDDPFQWPIKVNDAACSDCCDYTTCSVNQTTCEDIASKAAEKAAKDAAATAKKGKQSASASSGHSPFSILIMSMTVAAAMMLSTLWN